jgi:hypothetical protein
LEPGGTDLGFQGLRRSSFQRPFCGWRLAAGQCPFGDQLEPANDAPCSIRDQREGAERFLFFLLGKVFCFGFQEVAGAKPPPGAGRITATYSPDSPTNSSDESIIKTASDSGGRLK